LVPPEVVTPGLSSVALNGRVLGFAVLATITTTLVFGAVALVTIRLDNAAAVLVGAGRTSASGVLRRLASSLVVAEVALAITLLVGAGLILRTFASLLSVDPGFRYDQVLTMSMALPADRYRDSLVREAFYTSAASSIGAI